METIAITEWNDVVSPLFDAACCWHIVRRDGSGDTCNVKSLSLLDKSERCSTEAVTVMICGAISVNARSLLEERGVKVIPWVCGSIQAVIAAYQSGEDLSVRFAMPGCRGSGCRGRRRRGRHGREIRVDHEQKKSEDMQ